MSGTTDTAVPVHTNGHNDNSGSNGSALSSRMVEARRLKLLHETVEAVELDSESAEASIADVAAGLKAGDDPALAELVTLAIAMEEALEEFSDQLLALSSEVNS